MNKRISRRVRVGQRGVRGQAASNALLQLQSRKAALAGDLATMLEHIDVFAVKSSLKADLLAMLQERVDSTEGLLVGAFGAALAAAMLEPAVDAIVTPGNLALMVQGHMLNLEMEPRVRHGPSNTLGDAEVRMVYQSLGNFSVSIEQQHGAGDPITLLFRREGLFARRLHALRLPIARNPHWRQAAQGTCP